MKLAIIIPTYMREDGRSIKYLNRAIKSIIGQSYKDYKLFIIGDKYENKEEFNNLINKLDNISYYSINLSFALERDKYYGINNHNLWCAGGVNAINYGIDKALEDNYQWICHLDHDDYWEPNHLERINQVIEEDPLCGFVHTCSTYLNGQYLPYVDLDGLTTYRYPIPCHIVHSSVCINHKLIPLKYRDVFKETGISMPADIDMWHRLSDYCSINNINSILIKEITCHHTEEQNYRII